MSVPTVAEQLLNIKKMVVVVLVSMQCEFRAGIYHNIIKECWQGVVNLSSVQFSCSRLAIKHTAHGSGL